MMSQLKRGIWLLKHGPAYVHGFRYGRRYKEQSSTSMKQSEQLVVAREEQHGEHTPYENPLRTFFYNHKKGRGIMKWDHYFDTYHKHLAVFRGKPVTIVEIGVHSGGSLEMWKQYFGPQCVIHGIDIDPKTTALEKKDEGIHIHIGDQGDPVFWAAFKKQVSSIDIVIDDGSHNADDQKLTLETLLPHMNRGGVFICEDVKRYLNPFTLYMQGLANNLNAVVHRGGNTAEEKSAVIANDFQQSIGSVHFYPYMSVVEKLVEERKELVAIRRGDQWK